MLSCGKSEVIGREGNCYDVLLGQEKKETVVKSIKAFRII